MTFSICDNIQMTGKSETLRCMVLHEFERNFSDVSSYIAQEKKEKQMKRGGVNECRGQIIQI